MTINCAGMNCRHPEENHSPECVAEHAASVAGGRFVKTTTAQPMTTELVSEIAVRHSTALRGQAGSWDFAFPGYMDIYAFALDLIETVNPSAPAVDAGARDEREAFEHWITTEGGYDPVDMQTRDDVYILGAVEEAWLAWQGRAALSASTEAAAGEPVAWQYREALNTFESLHKFLNAAGAEGLVLDGIDGGDLFMSIFDADGKVSARIFSDEVRALAFQELFDFQEATGCDTAAEYRASTEEPIYQVFMRGLKVYVDTTKEAYDNNLRTCPEDTRIVYVTPPAASGQKLTGEQRGALRVAADALIERYAEPIRAILRNAERVDGLTVQGLRTLMMRHAKSYSEWDCGSLERVDFGQYGFDEFARALLRASEGQA